MNDYPGDGPVKFTCTRCGACCISLRTTIKIERKAGPRDYYCRDAISGNLSLVHIDAPYVPFFKDDSEEIPGIKNHCPFLVLMPEGYACAVYQTRPLVCRAFRCCRMRIFTHGGQMAGKVTGRRSLTTDNPDLLDIWNTRVASLHEENDGRWDMLVKEILSKAGFIVELYGG
ncbi:MAG TPA: YkgJ family cysteine cluster protein [Methanoregulaceae archaeon]|nr:YkgJ family cysteine cluster protein [Methanoregulaceae archaeon]